jgi:3-methylfumaryl-CoA hydratase
VTQDSYADWIGRSEEVGDTASPGPLAGLNALFDRADSSDDGVLPPLAHWCYFLPRARQSEIGEDGHPRRGPFLPPIALPRRMWAGGRVTFLAPMPIGSRLVRRTTIVGIEPKTGASGTMIFVKLRHEISAQGDLAIIEEQDIVYRGAPSEALALPVMSPQFPGPMQVVVPDPVMLFRFSALTFNAHRIHYDRPYATEVEGYPGLVVHGPLTAMLLLNASCGSRADSVASFDFQARRPLFAGSPFGLRVTAGTQIEAEAVAADAQVAMRAVTTFAQS